MGHTGRMRLATLARHAGLVTLSVLLAAQLTACGSATSEPSAASGSQPSPSGTGRIADLGFTATTLDGDTFDGNTLAGKPAVLWFWAPWCPTCRAQIGNVSALAEQYAGEVAVVGVGGLDGTAAIKAVAADIPSVTHLIDPDAKVWRHFGVSAQSSYTVIAADGEILSEGYLDDEALNALVAQLAPA